MRRLLLCIPNPRWFELLQTFYAPFKNIYGYNLALRLNGVSLDIIWANRKMVRGNKVKERYWDIREGKKWGGMRKKKVDRTLAKVAIKGF